MSYLEKPNILYLPLTGEGFVHQLLRPLDLETLVLLRGAGWEIDDILRVFAQYINHVPNAPTGSGSTPEGTPEYAEFLQLVEALDELEGNASLILAVSDASDNELVLSVLPHGRTMAEYKELTNLLELNPDHESFIVRSGYVLDKGDVITISTRPIMSALFYLGQSIEIPDEIRQAGYVNSGLAEGEQGEPFDWSVVHDELFQVHTAREKPDNAYAAVQYGDYWYYVDNTDVDSKETLTMLSVVLTLKAGGEGSTGPVLTLPVGNK